MSRLLYSQVSASFSQGHASIDECFRCRLRWGILIQSVLHLGFEYGMNAKRRRHASRNIRERDYMTYRGSGHEGRAVVIFMSV